ncbi:MAG: LCP family protein [Oscillospiraceae bacterium]|jgi:LCP family protein required for cell wall assembly|nr:LCP family protein [Oscillospiraceae bacterium]MDE6996298.1 LCP family protein [Oscillospiraceae bacterium]
MRRVKRRTSALQGLAVAAICILFVATALVGLYKCFSKEPEPRRELSQSSPDGGSAQEPEDGGAVQPVSARARKERFHTILIGGLDDENGGSDTNLLVAVDAKNGKINVASLPRDTLLNVSWSVKKLNNAYHHGGFSQTMAEVSRLLGIPVDHYVTVNLQAFVELVDAIEGVDFEIPVDMDYDDPSQDLHIHFSKGLQHLDGQQSLEVVRWRQNNDGAGYPTADIGRIGTQQAFLRAVAEQTLQLSNWDKVGAMADIFKKWVDTDLELANLIWLGEQALTVGSGGIAFHTLPGDGAGYYKGGSYYVLDPEAVLEMVNSYFNPYQEDLTLDDMVILVP